MPLTDCTTHAETVALFRYGLIADLRDVRPGDRSLHARLEEKAAREYASEACEGGARVMRLVPRWRGRSLHGRASSTT